MHKNNKKILAISAGILVFLIIIFSSLFFIFHPKTQNGVKNFTLTVVASTDNTKTFNLKSDEQYLGPALKKEGIISGIEYPETGIYITTVNNIKANENNKEYWQLLKDNIPLEYGADLVVLNDGDNFEFTLSRY